MDGVKASYQKVRASKAQDIEARLQKECASIWGWAKVCFVAAVVVGLITCAVTVLYSGVIPGIDRDLNVSVPVGVIGGIVTIAFVWVGVILYEKSFIKALKADLKRQGVDPSTLAQGRDVDAVVTTQHYRGAYWSHSTTHNELIDSIARDASHAWTTELVDKWGADIDVCFDTQQTPLSTAIHKDNIVVVNFLLDRGVKTDNKQYLVYAITQKRPNIVALFIKKNIGLEDQGKIDRAIDTAIECDDGATLELMLKKGHRHSQNQLLKALQNKKNSAAQMLIQHNVGVLEKDDKGRNPLHYCAAADLVPSLVEKGVGVNEQDVEGKAPLHLANANVAKALLEKRANPNLKDGAGNTPLHVAVNDNDVEKCRVLCMHGARTNITNDAQFTPMMRATHHSNKDKLVNVLSETVPMDRRRNINAENEEL